MIRDRREEDLDRLAEVLAGIDAAVGVRAGRTPGEWLREVDAEVSWVFDQAPVSVAPTRNVVGHVQVYRPSDAEWARRVRADTGVVGVLLIGRLFVEPSSYDHGIARFLLREAVRYVEAQARLPVLDPADAALVPSAVIGRLGFRDVAPDGPDRVWVKA